MDQAGTPLPTRLKVITILGIIPTDPPHAPLTIPIWGIKGVSRGYFA